MCQSQITSTYKAMACTPNMAPWWRQCIRSMAAVHDCGFELVDHPPYSPDLAPSHYFLFPNMQKTLGWEAVSDQWWGHICSWGLFQGSGWELLYHGESKCCNTNGRNVWTAEETMLKNRPHLVIFDYCIIVSLWTFQLTLVFRNIFVCSWYFTF